MTLSQADTKQLSELQKSTILVRRTFGPDSPLLRNEAEPEKPFDPAAIQILVAVALAGDGITVTALAETLGFNHSSVSNAVRKLKQAKLVRARPLPDDKRSSYLFITANGEARAKLVSEFADGVR